jgi:hypothetical protein
VAFVDSHQLGCFFGRAPLKLAERASVFAYSALKRGKSVRHLGMVDPRRRSY